MPAKTHPKYETPDVLCDSPLENEDEAHFHFEAFAATLARLIADKNTRTPLTIGVSGPWGSGKTTLLRRLRRQLDQTTAFLHRTQPAELDFANPLENQVEQFRVCRTVWFNAWKYADEDALLVALVRVIVQTMATDQLINQLLGKMLDPSYPRRDVINTVLSWFSIKVEGVEVGLNTGVPKPTAFAEKTAMLDLFDDAFERLMAAWIHRKLSADQIDPKRGVLVVFIDDLDRCLPRKTVQVLEAIKLFMDKPGCVFVLGADASVVRAAVESHYQNEKVTGQNAADYLEKIIQLRFDLPPVADAAMQSFLTGQKVNPELLAEWRTLLAAAEVNPRRVKAVINEIDLQWRMLVNSEQAEGVQRADFIRWNAVWRVAPPAFREVLLDIDDPDHRLKFLTDALRWGAGEGDETLARTFKDYEKDGRRLRRVLRQLKAFGPGFDAQSLNAFIYLTAPLRLPLEPSEPEAASPDEAKGAGLKETAEQIAGQGKFMTSEDAQPEWKTWAGIDFVRVPAGKFLMGSKEDNPLAYEDEKPQHTVDILQEFWIGRFPVTNARFEAFVQARGYQTTAEEKGSGYSYTDQEWKEVKGVDWRHPRGPASSIEGKADHPVVLASWLDAVNFCRWLNEAHGSELPSGWQFRLPTEAEWEKAARGEYGSEWPWGGQGPDATLCNFGMNVGDTTPVGKYSPKGDSPYRASDMAGNVWEWTHTQFANYPYRSDDEREADDSSAARVVRGGAFNLDAGNVRCAVRLRNLTYLRLVYIGFRVAASPIHL